jgi:hypothetical protein
MSRPTLIFLKAHYVGGRLAHCHGDEVPPGLFAQETIDRALDEHYLAEIDSADRRSLYRLLHHFSASKESEQLTNDERNQLSCT